MSLTSMGRASARNKEAQAEATRQADTQAEAVNEPDAAPAAVPSAEEAKAGLAAQLLGYIPADALAGYVAVTAFILDSSALWRFLAVAGIAVLAPIWVVIAYRDSTDDLAVLEQWPVFQMVIGAAAFVAWSMSVPGSWWQADLELSAQAGAGIAVAASILIGVAVRYYLQQHRVAKATVRI